MANTTFINGVEYNDKTQYESMDETILKSKVHKLTKRIESGKKITSAMQKIMVGMLLIILALAVAIMVQNHNLNKLNSTYSNLKAQYDSIKVEYASLAVEYASLKTDLDNLKVGIEEMSQDEALTEIQVVNVKYSSFPGFTYNENIPLSKEVQEYAFQKCSEIGMNYNIFLGMMRKESGFDPNAVSGTSDYGLCQINECNHKTMYNTFGSDWDWSNPYDSIDAATYLLKGIIPNYNNWHHVLMAYNAGVKGAKEKYFDKGIYSTKYSRAVLEYAEEYGYSGDGTIF